MKTLIVYTGNHRCTESIAEKMKEDLGENVVLANLRKEPNPDLNEFERVIVGGSFLNGQMQKRLKTFCQKNHATLLMKELGLYVCCMEGGKTAKELLMNIYPEDLYNSAKSVAVFKTGLDFSRMNFLEKLIARNVKRLNTGASKVDNEAVRRFSRRMDRVFNPFLFLA